jgi:hypothetical protein
MKDKKDKIYYFQEKSNDILDLQDELTVEEIGIYFILKAGYFKYAGDLKKENANQRCKFFGDINKFNLMISKLFDKVDGLLVNKSWLSEVKGIKALSEKRKEIAESRWKTQQVKKEDKPSNNPKKLKVNPEEPKETQLVLINNFETFWNFYTPVAGRDGTSVNKGNKADAKKSYEKAIALNFSHERIMQALEFYLKECQKNARFTKHTVSWLNQAMRDEFKSEQSAVIQTQPQPQKLTQDQLQDKINEELIKIYSLKNVNN